jgi:hypothetical protein
MQGWPTRCADASRWRSSRAMRTRRSIGAAAYLRHDLPSETAGQRRFQHDAATGTVSWIRCDIGFFPARLGRICCEPFEGEIGSDKTNGVTSATARQHH